MKDSVNGRIGVLLVRKGDWVRIHEIILKPEERAPQVPDDTKKVPLELWVNGFILHDAEVGDRVTIETMTGRKITGVLVETNPRYTHNFGEAVPQLLTIGRELKRLLEG